MKDLKFEKFNVGDPVIIVRLIGSFTIEAAKTLIGRKSTIEEVDDLPNGDYNYTLADGTYVHEEELEFDVPKAVLQRLSS